MNYWKLFLPIPIAILIALSTIPFESQYRGYNIVIGIIVKCGLLIYYLRLSNSGTPLINSLTAIIIIMLAGEYYIFTKAGQLVFVFANIALGITYLLRQKLKNKKDKLAGVKTGAIFLFALINIISVFELTWVTLMFFGYTILTGVYFYDRLVKLGELKMTVNKT